MTLSEAARRLSERGIEDAVDEARILFERIGGIPRYRLIDRSVECDTQRLLCAIERRCAREPLAYIIGEVDFYRESYEVTRDCLIPRSDTELLVDLAVARIPEGELFLDLCTGSGCVAISTLKNTVGTRAVGIDISDAALKIAEKNAKRNGVEDRLRLVQKDLFSSDLKDYHPYAILSNPPYVTETAYAGLKEEIFFEPKIAFTSGEDGLDLIRRLIPLCREAVRPDGFIAFEIGYDQGESAKALAVLHGLDIEIHRDLGGRDRVALFKLAKASDYN